MVSVIVPAFNVASFIGESLQSALAQTHKNIEVIVVDDGSADETRQIAEGFARMDPRVRVLHQSNQGVAVARNLGIEQARGDYVAPLDADDAWFPQKLEKQLACIHGTDALTGLVYGWYLQVSEDGVVVGEGGTWDAEGFVYNALALRNFVGGGSMPVIKRACFETVGGYSSTLRARGGEGCEDWELYLRIAERYQFLVVREHLLKYRRRRANLSSNREGMSLSQKLVIEGLERPGRRLVPSRILRWTKARRCLYELTSAARNRSYRSALALLLGALRFDPVGLAVFLYDKLLARSGNQPNAKRANTGVAGPMMARYEFLSVRRWQKVILQSRTSSKGATPFASQSESRIV